MKSLNELKLKLIQRVCESDDFNLLSVLLKNMDSKDTGRVSEPNLSHDGEKPMTDEEVEEYFREEELILPQQIIEILKVSEKQIANGECYSNEEVEAYFEEWLKD